MIAIQQEFEHNITQQVYVSEQLWQIVKIARDDMVNIINLISEDIDQKAPSKQLAQTLILFYNQKEGNSIEKALMAVRREASLLVG